MIYFTKEELACKHCGLYKLHPAFFETLNILRERFGEPMVVRSCCRCKEYNDSPEVHGHPKSLHVADFPAHAAEGQRGTLAIDIEAKDGTYRGRLFSLAWKEGWSIGWNAKLGFLHLDRRDWIGLAQTTFDY